MRWLTLLVIAQLGSAVGAAPALPAKIVLQSDAERASRIAEFRKRNKENWRLVEADAHGFISHLNTSDPALVPASTKTFGDREYKRIVAFVRANADLFGVDVADVDALAAGQKLLFTDELGGTLLGEINIQYLVKAPPDERPQLELYLYFHVTAKPMLTEADLAKRVIGATYHDTVGYAAPSGIDCNMTPAGQAGCVTPVEHTRELDVVLGSRDLRTVTMLMADGNTMRIVGCVEASMLAGPPADPAWGKVSPRDHALVPRKGAPKLPLVVDLVTGVVVTAPVHDCNEPRFAHPR